MTAHDDAEVAAHWNRNADQWARDVRDGLDVYREAFTFPAFQAFLPALSGLDVVDFGCGEGTNTRRFAQDGARLTGIDLSQRMIALAWQTEAADPLGIAYAVRSYSDHTGLPAAAFDAVVSTMALMDGPDFPGAMREAYRLLRPGGFLAFSILHPCFITPGLRWEKDAQGHGTELHVSRYFEGHSFVEEWHFAARARIEPGVTLFSVPRFPRTLGDYLTAVAAAGFRIARVEEPRPSEAATAARPQKFGRWRDHAAFLLLVLAERPA